MNEVRVCKTTWVLRQELELLNQAATQYADHYESVWIKSKFGSGQSPIKKDNKDLGEEVVLIRRRMKEILCQLNHMMITYEDI